MNKISSRITLVLIVLLGIGIGLTVRHFWFSPESADPRFINNENFKEIRAELESEVASNPQDPTLHIELADFLYNYYPYAETGSEALISANDHFQHAIDLLPTQTGADALTLADLYFKQGNLAREQKNYTGAIVLFEKGVNLDPENSSLKYNIAFTYLNDLGDLDQAESWMKKIGNALKDDPAFHYNFARIYFAKGDFTSAEAALEITMQLDPANAHIVRGDLYKRVLEAQGKELPEDSEVPIIDAEFSETE